MLSWPTEVRGDGGDVGGGGHAEAEEHVAELGEG